MLAAIRSPLWRRNLELSAILVGVSSVCVTSALASAPQTNEWIPTFGQSLGASDIVFDVVEFDDGSGSSLYACGAFEGIGGAVVNGVARFDGVRWHPLGNGANNDVYVLHVHDDGLGGGPALYAGGVFTSIDGVAANHIARWDGSSWQPLGSGLDDSPLAMCSFDDGSGERLFVGGNFDQAGGSIIRHLAAWDGAGWSKVSAGVGPDRRVRALHVFDDGSGAGERLFVAGDFDKIDGVTREGVAAWDGTNWAVLGPGIAVGNVFALETFDDGSGDKLYVGASFTALGQFQSLVTWDGASWQQASTPGSIAIKTMLVADDGLGAGPVLFVGGIFATSNPIGANGIARFDGSTWTTLGTGLEDALGSSYPVETLHWADLGSGERLIAGGRFQTAGGLEAPSIAQWAPLSSTWSTLTNGLDGSIRTAVAFDDGGGDEVLIVGGAFTLNEGTPLKRIARWTGGAFEPFGEFDNGIVHVLHVHDDGLGSGPILVAGGSFTSSAGVPTAGVARWDGSAWQPLGLGVTGSVRTLATHDDGGGVALFVGGEFTQAGGAPAANIAKWDGGSWSTLAAGSTKRVDDMVVFDDGSGPGLYVAGGLVFPSFLYDFGVSRWDGVAWSPVGVAFLQEVLSLAVHDDGSGAGPQLYAGGRFTSYFPTSGLGVPMGRLARFDGTDWQPFGQVPAGEVRALAVHTASGSPARLFIGGSFDAVDNVAAKGVAVWDGSTFEALDRGVSPTVYGLTTFDDAFTDGPALHVFGTFQGSPGGDAYLARWGVAEPGYTVVTGCSGTNSATLAIPDVSPRIGAVLPLDYTTQVVDSGFAVTLLGATAIDLNGCGLDLGFGEFLIANFPGTIADIRPFAGYSSELEMSIPDNPSLVGIRATLQGGFVGVAANEISNALEVFVMP